MFIKIKFKKKTKKKLALMNEPINSKSIAVNLILNWR